MQIIQNPVFLSALFFIIGGVIGVFYQKTKQSRFLADIEVLKNENAHLRSFGQEAEKIRQESLQAAKAAVLEVSQTISSKLIEDHKRENQEVKKQSEDMIVKTTEKLNQQFSDVVQKLASVQGQANKSDSKISTIWQALSSTSGAGQFAEIGLENTLKNFGLEKGRDFDTQLSLNHEGARLRPDAMVYLPEGNLMVIDAKSSKFFLEIAQGEQDEQKLMTKLAQTMANHLNDLVTRDYQQAAKTAVDKNATIVNVMYVANDAFLNKILQAEPDFRQKCAKKNILLADPTTLQLLLQVCVHQISRAKQEHNYQQILAEMGKVISSLDVFLRNIESVGKAIKSSAENFAKLGSSVNSRLLPRVKRILDLGVESENKTRLPEAVPEFRVIESQAPMIDLEDSAIKIQSLEKKVS